MMILTPPLTLVANPVAANTTNPSVTDSLIDQLRNTYQIQLNSQVKRVEAQATKVLMDVLVKGQLPLDKNLRQQLTEVLKQPPLQTGLNQKSQPLATLLSTKGELYLVKLQTRQGTQWAVSPQQFSAGKTLSIAITPENNAWKVLQHHSPTPAESLQQAMRDNLPKATDLASAFRVLAKMQQQIIPKQAIPKQGIATELRQALNKLQQLTPTPRQLSAAATLKQSLLNSGIGMERKFAAQTTFTTTISNPTTNTIVPQQKISPSSNAFEKILRNIISSRTIKSAQPSSNNPEAIDLNKDLKAQLLLIKQLTTILLKPVQPTKTATDTNIIELQKEIAKASAKPERSKLSPKQQQTIQQIQQQVIAAIAKIQVQQTQSLLQQRQAGVDSKGPTTILQLEIPVHYNDDFHNMRMHVEEEWLEREHNDKDRRKIKRWRVNLSIELPDAGRFFACITHMQNETKVKLWADRQSTATKVRKGMEDLKQRLSTQGIQVKSLTCEFGTPVQNNNQVNCALVDVLT